MEDYLKKKAEREQNFLVNARSPMSVGPSIYFWTHRVTSTDVISVITTTKIYEVGDSSNEMGLAMDKEKVLVLAKTESNTGGPLQQGGAHDAAEHARRCQELRLERAAFLGRLAAQRRARWRAEAGAARRLQAAWRGRRARRALGALAARLRARKRARAALRRGLLAAVGGGGGEGEGEEGGGGGEGEGEEGGGGGEGEGEEGGGGEDDAVAAALAARGWRATAARAGRARRAALDRAARRVQAAWRGHRGRRAGRRRARRAREEARRAAARRLQGWARAGFARRRARRERRLAYHEARAAAARAAQGAWRRHRARRAAARRRAALRAAAVLAVQAAWRRRLGKHRAEAARRRQRAARAAAAAVRLQRRARGWLGRAAARRRRHLARARARHAAALALQRAVRRRQAARRAAAARRRRAAARRAAAAAHLQRAARGRLARRRAAEVRDVRQIDIFEQARADNAAMVELLISGEFGDDYRVTDRDARGRTALMVAAEHGALATVRKCLATSPRWDANAGLPGAQGWTAAHLAARRGKGAAAEYLAQRGGLDLRRHGASLALCAARWGQEGLLKVMVALLGPDACLALRTAGAPPAAAAAAAAAAGTTPGGPGAPGLEGGEGEEEEVEVAGRTLLHQAVLSGAAGAVRAVLAALPALEVDAADADGRTALHLAAAGSSAPAVQALLNAGPDVRRRDRNGLVPAIRAALHGTEEVAQLLIRYWDDIDEMVVDKWTDDDDIDAVIKLAERGKTALLRRALDAGFPPRAVHWATGDTLATAAGRAPPSGRDGVVRLCAERGCDLKHANNAGRTVAHEAAAKPEILTWLMSHGIGAAELAAADHRGVTPLMVCAGAGGAVGLLAPGLAPEQVNMKDVDGMTALHYAAKGFHIDAATSLLAQGAAAAAATLEGATALHLAAASEEARTGCLAGAEYEALVAALADGGAAVGGAAAEDAAGRAPPEVALGNGAWMLLAALARRLLHKEAAALAFKCITYNAHKGLQAVLKHCQEYPYLTWTNSEGLTLMGAACQADAPRLALLLATEFGFPLEGAAHCAAFYGAQDVLQALLLGTDGGEEAGDDDATLGTAPASPERPSAAAAAPALLAPGALELPLRDYAPRVAALGEEVWGEGGGGGGGGGGEGGGGGGAGDTAFCAALRGGRADTAWWLWRTFRCRVKPALRFHCAAWIVALARLERDEGGPGGGRNKGGKKRGSKRGGGGSSNGGGSSLAAQQQQASFSSSLRESDSRSLVYYQGLSMDPPGSPTSSAAAAVGRSSGHRGGRR